VKSVTVARNYAEALFEAAQESRQLERYGRLMEAVAGAVQADPRIAVALESPRVSKAQKAALVERGLARVAPKEFVRFLQAVLRRGRQGILSEIATEYAGLVDLSFDRVHAGVTLARPADRALEREIVARLKAALGKEVRAHFRDDRSIIGGVVVRVGDRIYDGSLRRRVAALKRRMAGED